MTVGKQTRAGGERAEPAGGEASPSPSAGRQTLTEMAYPHGGVIAAAVGGSVPGKAVLDPGGCEERGVPAFTDGLVTHFASPSPDVHVAAHEAAHQLQH